MPDENTATSGTATEGQTQAQGAGTETAKTFSQEELNRILKREIDKEVKPFKEKATAYDKLLEDEKAKKTAELSELEKLKLENTELTKYKTVAEEYEASISATVKAKIEAIPEERKSLVPEGLSNAKLLEWLEKNSKILAETGEPVTTHAAPTGGKPPSGKTGTVRQQAIEKTARYYPNMNRESDEFKARVDRIEKQLIEAGVSA